MLKQEDKDEFYASKDEILANVAMGIDAALVCRSLGLAPDTLTLLCEEDDELSKEVDRVKSLYELKLAKKQAELVESGDHKALKAVFDESSQKKIAKLELAIEGLERELKAQPVASVEFKRGDMRTPDEITITNTEGFEKKSLSRLLSAGCSKS